MNSKQQNFRRLAFFMLPSRRPHFMNAPTHTNTHVNTLHEDCLGNTHRPFPCRSVGIDYVTGAAKSVCAAQIFYMHIIAGGTQNPAQRLQAAGIHAAARRQKCKQRGTNDITGKTNIARCVSIN